jgi:hypothetical protein
MHWFIRMFVGAPNGKKLDRKIRATIHVRTTQKLPRDIRDLDESYGMLIRELSKR